MKTFKIKRRRIRILLSIIGSLLVAVAGILIVYEVGLISPLTKSLAFGFAYGVPDTLGIILSGLFTMLPFGVVGLIIWGLYKVGKTVYKRLT